MTPKKKATRRQALMPDKQPFRLDSRTVRSLVGTILVVLGMFGLDVTELESEAIIKGILQVAALVGTGFGIYYRVNRRAA